MADGIRFTPAYSCTPVLVYSDIPEQKIPINNCSNAVEKVPKVTVPTTTNTTTCASTEVATTSNLTAAANLELKKQKIQERLEEKEEQKGVIAAEVYFIKHGDCCLLGTGAFFALLALALAVVAFATPEWRVYQVDERKARIDANIALNPSLYICTDDPTVTTCQFFTTRRRGLFVTCYTNSSFFPKVYKSDVMAGSWLNGDKCVWAQKYNIQSTPIRVADNCAEDPSMRGDQKMVEVNSNLMRTHWLAFAIAILLLLISLIISIVSCCQVKVEGSMCAGITLLIATFLLLIGMAVFHGYTAMEEDTLRCPPFFGVMRKEMFSGVYRNTEIYYGFSFYLGWSSFGISILATGFVLAAACRRCDSQAVIDKAMSRLRTIANDERADKRLEEKEEKLRRKAMEKQLKLEKKKCLQESATGGIFGKIKIKGKKKVKANISDSEIDYEILKTKKDKEEILRKLRDQVEIDIAKEKGKINAKKAKELKKLEKAQRDLADLEIRIRNLEKNKKGKERKQKMEDSCSDDSDSDVEMRKKCKSKRKRCTSVDTVGEGGNWFSVDSKCGKVVGARDYGHYNNCCDPYTLHLPSGFNPPPYRP